MVNISLWELWNTMLFRYRTGHSNPGQHICLGSAVIHKHVTVMKYVEYYFNFLFKYTELW